MKEKIRVLIADDHVHQREGFKQLLNLSDCIEVISEARSAQEAVQKALSLEPDVAVIDLVWYGDRTAGISAIRQIKQEAPQIKILAPTVYPELIEAARIAGADLALDKGSVSDQSAWIDRIREIYEARGFPKPQADLPEKLSERELDVLKLMAQGDRDQDIAEKLSISVTTVKKHVSNILGKLGVTRRSGAVAVGYERGILPRGTVEL